jgi:hypothetical protein
MATLLKNRLRTCARRRGGAAPVAPATPPPPSRPTHARGRAHKEDARGASVVSLSSSRIAGAQRETFPSSTPDPARAPHTCTALALSTAKPERSLLWGKFGEARKPAARFFVSPRSVTAVTAVTAAIMSLPGLRAARSQESRDFITGYAVSRSGSGVRGRSRGSHSSYRRLLAEPSPRVPDLPQLPA